MKFSSIIIGGLFLVGVAFYFLQSGPSGIERNEFQTETGTTQTRSVEGSASISPQVVRKKVFLSKTQKLVTRYGPITLEPKTPVEIVRTEGTAVIVTNGIQEFSVPSDCITSDLASIKDTPEINANSSPNQNPANARSAGIASPTPVGAFTKYSRSLVIVEGDQLGSGFLIRFGKGAAIATNAHVLSGNRSPRFRTLEGETLQPLRVSVAKNIDLALVEVSTSAPPLPICETFAESVHMNDKVLVLGNSEGKGVATDLGGSVKGIGPDRIEVDAKFVEGNSGSPVILESSGEVIGIATYYLSPNIEEFSKKSAAVKDSRFWNIRRFAYRLDAVAGYDLVQLGKFAEEAGKIVQFNETTENIYMLAADLAFNDKVHIDWHNRRMNRLAIPLQQYVQQSSVRRRADHNSMDPRQQLLTRLNIECSADINLYRNSFVSTYHIKKLGEISQSRQQLSHLIERLLTQ